MHFKHWPLGSCLGKVVLIIFIFASIVLSSEPRRGHQTFRELNPDSISRLGKTDKDKTDLKGLKEMAIIHKQRFGILDVDSLKNKINPTRLEKRKGKSDLFLSSGIDSVLFQIETSEGQNLNVVVDKILDLDSPEYIITKDSVSSGTQIIWCHIGNDTINKFIVTLSKRGVHGAFPIPGTKMTMQISPLSENKHMVLEMTPNSTNPRWEGKE